MAAVAYTSRLADADVYRSEREREYRHVARVPNLERAEWKLTRLHVRPSDRKRDRVVEREHERRPGPKAERMRRSVAADRGGGDEQEAQEA